LPERSWNSVEDALAVARRGEFAGDAEVNAMYAKHGL